MKSPRKHQIRPSLVPVRALAIAAVLGISQPSLGQSQGGDFDREQLLGDLHLVHPTASGLQAHNLAQRLSLQFDERGLLATPDEGDWTWGLELQAYGPAGNVAKNEGLMAPEADGSRVSYSWQSGPCALTEWYVNRPGGVEHGFTLAGVPKGTSSYQIALGVRGELVPTVSEDGRDVWFGSERGSRQLYYTGLTVFDASGRELDAHFSRTSEALLLAFDVRDVVFPVTVDPVVQQRYIKGQSSDAADHFGISVAIDIDRMVIGASGEDSSATGVGGNPADNSMSFAGAAYVYQRLGGKWFFEAYLKASNTDAGDNFGQSVSISKNLIVVGARSEDGGSSGVDGNQADNSLPNSGAAYIFERIGGVWSQAAYLKAGYPDASDAFGNAVGVSGETVVVGADLEDSAAVYLSGTPKDNSANGAGATYVFTRTAGVWSQTAYLKSSNTEAADQFGSSVAIDGDLIAIGAPGEDSNATGINGNQADNSYQHAGAVYIFRLLPGAWKFVAYVKASNTGFSDNFGSSVAVDGQRVIVGAPDEDSVAADVGGDQSDNSLLNAGAAYVFEDVKGQWSQMEYLKASNPMLNAEFGGAVDIAGDKCIVGAHRDRSAGFGVNGKSLEVGAYYESGAAHVFNLAPSGWAPLAFLKQSANDAGDQFGVAVAVSDSDVLVGAPFEDGSGSLTGGDPTTNGKMDSGSAEVFDLEASCGASRYGSWTAANIADIYSRSEPGPGSPFEVHISDFAAGGPGLLAISGLSADVGLLGGKLLVDLTPGVAVYLPITIVGGAANLTLSIPIGLAGTTVFAQAAAIDFSQSESIAWTTGLRVTLCP